MRKMNGRVVALYILAPALLAAAAVRNSMTLQPASKLWIKGTSTVRSFECKAGALEAKVETAAPGAAAALMAGDKAVTAASVTIPSAQLDCGNGTMNEHMKKARGDYVGRHRRGEPSPRLQHWECGIRRPAHRKQRARPRAADRARAWSRADDAEFEG